MIVASVDNAVGGGLWPRMLEMDAFTPVYRDVENHSATTCNKKPGRQIGGLMTVFFLILFSSYRLCEEK
jgi:hypothetical protein